MNSRKSIRNLNLILLLTTCLFLSGFIIFSFKKVKTRSPEISVETKLHETRSKVTKVFDGDTIQIEGGQKVRYIGIDSAETYPKQECFSYESKNVNEELVLDKNITLVSDVSDTDKYGRLLRYVYVDDIGNNSKIFVNDFLVKNGFALAKSYSPDIKFKNMFFQSEQNAQKNSLGLWGKCKN